MNIWNKLKRVRDALRVFLVMCWNWLVNRYKNGFILYHKSEMVYCEFNVDEYEHNVIENYFVLYINPCLIRYCKWHYDGLPIIEVDFIIFKFTYSETHFWHCCKIEHSNYQEIINCAHTD